MNKFFKEFNHISLKKDGRILGFGTSPEADWKIIVYSTALLVLCMFAFNIYIFIKIDKGEIFTTERIVESNRTLDVQKLESVVSHYIEQEAEYENVKKSLNTTPDPSI